jgi:hypothetical protein
MEFCHVELPADYDLGNSEKGNSTNQKMRLNMNPFCSMFGQFSNFFLAPTFSCSLRRLEAGGMAAV